MIAVDTNILVYAIDVHEPQKMQVALSLLAELTQSQQRIVLLWQVAAEYLATLTTWEKKGRHTRAETELYLDQLISILPIDLPTIRILSLSLELSGKHSLSHWDSMLLAACQEVGVTTLYSEDLTNGATYSTVTVINPFA